MKKIINNKVYDTKTAQKVGEWDNGQWDNKLYICTEELYRKKTGEFFLYGYGGPGSKYAKAQGNNNWTSGEKIIPLSYKAAQKWAEEHLDGEDYEKIFGKIQEDETKTTITIYLKTAKAEKYKRNAAIKGTSLTTYIEETLDKATTEEKT